ncbi:tudor domain-containing protein 1-like [Embiotoca jacksoni]|uniref:tudor domain-containing protein 1-like n=1 Tax=Embiotoca jacksoni TaxID=100190 RepID=UPI003704A33E
MMYVPCVGEVCVIQFSCDLNWYRGLVQTLDADHKMPKVLNIDFGNEESVPVDRIRPMTTNIQPFCSCAMECRIVGVVPVVGKWSGECCITVRQLLVGKTVTVRLLETLENGRWGDSQDIPRYAAEQFSNICFGAPLQGCSLWGRGGLTAAFWPCAKGYRTEYFTFRSRECMKARPWWP